jgi:K+-transporting ATPase ATPase B chain
VLTVTVLAALLVTLIPTTIGGLLSAIGIAGMDRLVRFNVIATSGRAVEAAGDVDTLLLDKTGTITFGNRMASDFARCRASRVDELPRQPAREPWPTKRRRAARSSRSPPANSALPCRRPALRCDRAVHGRDPAVGRRSRWRGLRKGAVDAVLKFTGLE